MWLQVADPKKRYTPHQILNHKWVTQKECRTLPLTHTMANLKAFNARKRMRMAIHAVRAAHIFKAGPSTATGDGAGMSAVKEDADGEDEAEAEEEAEDAAAAAAADGAGGGAGAGPVSKSDKSGKFDPALF